MKKINRKRIDVLNKKGISVLAIGIVLFSVLVSAIPVMAAGEITAMRDISNQAVNLGDTQYLLMLKRALITLLAKFLRIK